jgi:hypothetical protein
MASLGVGVWITALNVKYRDFRYVIPFIVQLGHENLGKKNITHGAPVSREYIRRAMEQFSDSVCFFVFSDTPKDIQWSRENIQARRIEFSSAESELWDFMVRFCDHNIISNSTFSW